MSGWSWDGSLNVEGLATAAAAVGAAGAYVIDLIGKTRRRRREERRGRRGRMIIELVQKSFDAGVSEAEIHRVLSSDEPACVDMRRRYRVPQHKAPETDEDLEQHLVALVFDRLLEIDAPEHYRLYGSHWFVRERKNDLERQSSVDARDTGAGALFPTMRDEMIERVWQSLRSGTAGWSTAELLASLGRLGAPPTAEQLRELMDAAPESQRVDVVQGVSRYLAGR